ncbi:F-box domain-containing protein [Madurella fahalii]|uniref:F-box domain-containing protein n=1 Tax=Madurella fahalii TaxID=1157608 RepID=A0ABQ0G7H0_9PEZI
MVPVRVVEPVPDPNIPPPVPAPPEPTYQSGSFVHGLIGLSSGGFSETVRHSISSLTSHHDRRSRREPKDKDSCVADPDPAAKREDASPLRDMDWQRRRPRHLLALPPELLLMILQRLNFADIVRLRETCKQLRALASPQQIRTLMGAKQLHLQLLGHCKSCLLHDPYRSRLLQSTMADPGYPLASRCLDCALEARDPRIRVGKKINLANFDTVWVCRWCGRPITEGAAFGAEQFHRLCYKRYNDALFGYFLLGWLQLSLGVVAPALAWRYFRHAVLVFAPTVTTFLLLWLCLGFLAFRGNRRRTYHWTLAIELAILGLWIPPVYYITIEIASAGDGPVPMSTQAALAMFALNMLFRLFNVLGNLVILFSVDTSERYRTGAPLWKKPLYTAARACVFWTYPQSLEQKLPPDYL